MSIWFPTHIPLRELKKIAPRLLYIEAVEANEDSNAHTPFLNSWDRLNQDFPDQWIDDDSVPLDAVVKRTVDYFRANHAQRYEAQITILQTVADQLSCTNCYAAHQGTAKTYCVGDRDSDSLVISSPGHCINPLLTLFNQVVEYTRTQYKDVTGYRDYDVKLATQHTYENPHKIAVPYPVTGSVTCGVNFSEVKVTLHPDRVQTRTVRALLYVLFHECVCHVFQGSVNQRDERDGCGPDDEFGEGWMDWIAVQLLSRFVQFQPPPVSQSQSCRDIAFEFHRERRRLNGSCKEAHAHHTGFSTAVMAKAMLDEVMGGDSWSVFLRLSFELNCLRLTLGQRRQLVRNLRSTMEPFFCMIPDKEWLAHMAAEGKPPPTNRDIQTFRYNHTFSHYAVNCDIRHFSLDVCGVA